MTRIRLALLAALLVLLLASAGARGAELRVEHGVRLVEGGQTVVVLHGTHRQRGDALGRLAGAEIVALVRDYGLQLLPTEQLAVLRMAAPFLVRFPPWVRAEAEGVVAGMDAAGVDRHVPALGRALDALDLLFLTTIPDIGGLACSSLSAWGGAAPDGPLLARNLDFTLPAASLPAVRAAQAVVVHVPSEPDEQPWLSVGLAGFLGTLSGYDRAGRGAFLNLDLTAERIPPARVVGRGVVPLSVALREGLERRDADGDGRTTLADLTAALRAHPRAGAVLVHALMALTATPRVAARTGPLLPAAVVIEADARGVTERAPDAGADHLVATNHARARRAPVACERFDALTEGAARHRGRLDAAVAHLMLGGVAFRGRRVRTMETMVWLPEADRIGVGFLGDRDHAGGAPLSWHSLSALRSLVP